MMLLALTMEGGCISVRVQELEENWTVDAIIGGNNGSMTIESRLIVGSNKSCNKQLGG
jgi:hypothetical protein